MRTLLFRTLAGLLLLFGASAADTLPAETPSSTYGPFLVNGVGVDMPLEEARLCLGKDCISGKSYLPWIGYRSVGLTGLKTPVIHMLHFNDKIAICIGDRLDFCGRTLLRRGDDTNRVDQLLGQPDLVPVDGAGPLTKRLYFRHGHVIDVSVSNDTYIRGHFPAKDWPVFCGKVWRFQLYSCDLDLSDTGYQGHPFGPGP